MRVPAWRRSGASLDAVIPQMGAIRMIAQQGSAGGDDIGLLRGQQLHRIDTGRGGNEEGMAKGARTRLQGAGLGLVQALDLDAIDAPASFEGRQARMFLGMARDDELAAALQRQAAALDRARPQLFFAP